MVLNHEITVIAEAIKSAIPVERIYLFGSYANGEPSNESDYDFFVLIPDDGIKPLDAMREARFSLIPLNRKIPVDIIADYKSRFEQRSKLNTLERKVANEGVVLYERA
jgi:predicted nucleotidyltransferase